MIAVYNILQWLISLSWALFQLCLRPLHKINHGFRFVYWRILQAKRRRQGQPRWRDHDFQIGVSPPCPWCGACVPVESHKSDCSPTPLPMMSEVELAASRKRTRDELIAMIHALRAKTKDAPRSLAFDPDSVDAIVELFAMCPSDHVLADFLAVCVAIWQEGHGLNSRLQSMIEGVE